MSRPAVILFDLDGTLIDTQELILMSFRYATNTVLGYELPNEEVSAMIGIPLAEQMRIIAPDHKDELVRVYRTHNHRLHDDLIKGFKGMDAVLDALLAEGYRLGVVTSKMHQLANRGLECFALAEKFELLLGSDDTDEHKPDPGPLLEAARQMQVTPGECAYIGDSPYDMQAARGANMLAVAALWGMFKEEELLQAGANEIAKTPKDLLDLFKPL